MKLVRQPKVILRDCRSYDPQRIRTIVREALVELDLEPFGRTLVKPNLVTAGRWFPHAFTRPEVVEGMLWALKDISPAGMSELAVGERCGITMPTRMVFAEAGYDEMLARVPNVVRYLFEETPQVEVPLSHAGRLRDYVFTPEPVAQADFFINVPKLKAHFWTTVTCALKNYIGIQDDRHRLIDHDYRLDEKIVDLQYVLQPRLVCVDAIVAGQGAASAPRPFDLQLLILGNNQVAVDAVCCHLIGLDPRSVDHIRLAEERGFGTTDLGQIEVSGDVSLEQAKQRGSSFEVGRVPVPQFFEGTNISAYAGPSPKPERAPYCWGGCPTSIEEAMEILRRVDERCDEMMPRVHVVFGAYDGPIEAKPGEKVVFIGDCAAWRGRLDGQTVEVASTYQPRSSRDPRCAKHDDIYVKLVTVWKKLFQSRHLPYVRFHGCPVSIAELVLLLASLSGAKNPILDPIEGFSFTKAYLAWRLSMMAKRLRGHRYQRPGPCARGAAAPQLDGASS